VKKRRRRVHPASSAPLVQVVELGSDFWCEHCGLLGLSDFSPTIEEAFDKAQQRFRDQYGHGLS
jgi:hypothetical protein